MRVFDIIVTKNDFFIFMEYMAGGDLYHYMLGLKRKLCESEAKCIIYQVTMAVSALHAQNIVHRDIKVKL